MTANFIPFINGASGDSNATLAIADALLEEQKGQDALDPIQQYHDLMVYDPIDIAGLSASDIQKKVDALQTSPFANWVGIYSGASMIGKMQPVKGITKVATTHLHYDDLFKKVLGKEKQSNPRHLDKIIRGELDLCNLYIPTYTLKKPLKAHFRMALLKIPTVPVKKSQATPASMQFHQNTLFCYLPAENAKNPEKDAKSQKKLAAYVEQAHADHVVLIPSMKTKGYLPRFLERFHHPSLQVTNSKPTGLLTEEVLPALKNDATSRIIFPVDSASVCAEVVDALHNNPSQAIMFEGAAKKKEHQVMARYFRNNGWTMSLEKGMVTKGQESDAYIDAAEIVASKLVWDYARLHI